MVSTVFTYMLDPIAEIFVQATLDTSSWESDVTTAAAKINRLPAIKPGVDSTELHALNKLLDVKQAHLRQTVEYYNSHPIAPKVDTSELNKLLSKRVNIETYVDLSSLKSFELQAGKSAQNANNSFLKALGKPFQVAIELPGRVIAEVATGALQGLGRELTKGMSSNLLGAINASLGSSIGSMDLLGRKLGDRLSASIAREIKQQQNANPIFRDFSAGIKAAAQDAIGKEAIAIEVQSRAFKERAAAERARQQARQGVLPSIREAEAALPSKRADYASARKTATDQLELLRMADRSAQRRQDKRAALLERKDIDDSERLLLNQNARRFGEEKAIRAEQRREILGWVRDQKATYSIALQQVKDLNQQLGQLIEKPLLPTYQKFLDKSAPGLARNKVPTLVRQKMQPNADGQIPNANYTPFNNKLALNEGLYDRVASGKRLTEKEARILSEEIEHAVDFDFGSLKGVEANRDSRLLKRKVKTTRKDDSYLKQIEKDLLKYAPEVRGIERNAKVKAFRNAGEFAVENRREAQGERLEARRNRSGDYWEDDYKALFPKRDGGFIKRDRVTGRGRRPKLEEIFNAEVVRSSESSALAKAKDYWNEAKEAETLLLDKFSGGIGRKAKNLVQAAAKTFALDRASDVKAFGGKAFNALGSGYDSAKRLEGSVLGMLPFGLGGVAKTGLQGAGAMAMLGGMGGAGQAAQFMLSGGASNLIGAGGHLLASGAGGMGGMAIEGIAGSLQAISPLLGAAAAAKGGEALINTVLPNQTTQNTRSVKQLQADNKRISALLEASPIAKALSSSADEAKKTGDLLALPGTAYPLEKTPEGMRRLGDGLKKAWGEVKKNLDSGSVAIATGLLKDLQASSVAFVAANKEVYSQLEKGSERDKLSSYSGDIGRQRKQVEAKLRKIKRELEEGEGLKRIELVEPLNNLSGDNNDGLRGSLNSLSGRREARRKRSRVGTTSDPIANAQIAETYAKEALARFAEVEQGIDKAPSRSVNREAFARFKERNLKRLDAGIEAVKDSDVGQEVGEKVNVLKGKLGLGVFALGSIAVAIGTAVLGVKDVLARQSAVRALENVSSDADAAKKSLDSATALSKKLGLSTTDSIKQAAAFRANLSGTGLEGLADKLGQGISVYGRAQGSNSEEIKRGKLAFGQIAGLPKLSAEELNQIDEAIPGFGALLASSSGYTKGRLRNLAGKGKIDSADVLANLSPVLTSQAIIKQAQLERSPQVKLDKFGSAAEDTKVKLEEALLKGLAPAAELAAKAIEFLNQNLSILGTAGIIAIAGFAAQALTTQIALQGLSVAAAGIKTAMLGLAGAALPVALVVGLASIIEASLSIGRIYSGENSPTQKLIDGYLEAAKAVADFKAQQDEVAKPIPELKAEGAGEQIASTLQRGANKINRFLGVSEAPTFEQFKGGEEQAKLYKGLGYAKTASNIDKSGFNIKLLAQLNEQVKAIELEAKIANPLENDSITAARAKKKEDLVNQRDKLNVPVNLQKILLEKAIQQSEAGIRSSVGNKETSEGYVLALGKQKAALDELNKSSSAYTDNILRIDDSLFKSISGFEGLGELIGRLGVDDATASVNLFAGSLYSGAKSTREFADSYQQLNRLIIASKAKVEAAKTQLQEEPIARQISTLQASGNLPQDLRDTSKSQLAKLKELGVDDRISQSIEFSNSAQAELKKQTSDQLKLQADRRTAMSSENKALLDHYQQTVTESIKAALQIKQQTQSLLQNNFSTALRSSMIGITGAVGNYINSTIEQFLKLQEIVTEKQSTQAKLYETQVKAFQADKDRNNAIQQYSGTDQSVATGVVGASNARPSVPGSAVYSTTAKYGNSGRHHDGGNYSQVGDLTISKNRGLSVKDLVLGGGTNADIPAPVGGRIKTYSPKDGRGFGYEVNVLGADGKIVALLGHMDKLLVKTGDIVNAGDAVGKQGSTGHSTGTHLHVEMPRGSEQAYLQMIKSGGSAKPTTLAAQAREGGSSDELLSKIMALVRLKENSGSYGVNARGDFPGKPGSANGAYQYSKGDYDEARRLDPSITNFSPANQDKIFKLRMGMSRGGGRNKGKTAFNAYAANPTDANLEQLLDDMGGEYEVLRDGIEKYQGRDIRKNFRGKLYGGTAGFKKALGNVSTQSVATGTSQSATPGVSPLIEADYQTKINQLDNEAKNILAQQNISTASKRMEAAALEFKRNQQVRIDRRAEAKAVRDKLAEQANRKDALGDPSSNKASAQAIRENKKFIYDATTEQAYNRQDYQSELKEFDRLESVYKELQKQKDIDPAARAVLDKLAKDMPLLRKNRLELFRATQAGLAQDIKLGKLGTEDLNRKRYRELRDENRASYGARIDANNAVGAEQLKAAEQYLGANPYNYGKGDPLTIKKQVALAVAKEANRKEADAIQDKIDKLDPNSGNFSTAKRYLLDELKDTQRKYDLLQKNTRSEYDQTNKVRQFDRKEYARNIAAESIGRSIESQKLLGNYEQAQGRTAKGAETISLAEGQIRTQQLEATIAALEKAALLDPRLQRNLATSIEEVKYQKQLLDYTAERVRYREREANLRSLTSQSVEAGFGNRQLDIDALNRNNNSYDARSASGALALDRQRKEYEDKRKELADLTIANESSPSSPFYAETKVQLQAIGFELDNLNDKKLSAIANEFSQFQDVINSTAKEGTRVLSDMLSGKGVDTNSLNSFLVAPFKAISDQLAGFLGGQWAAFVQDLMGGLVEGLNEMMSGAGSAGSPSGGNIFSAIINGIGSLFRGGGGNNPDYDSLDNYAMGGRIKVNSYMTGGKAVSSTQGQIVEAMQRERVSSGGREPVLLVANRDEMVLTPAQTKDYLKSQRIPSFASGGIIGGASYGNVSIPAAARAVGAPPRPETPTLKTKIINSVEYATADDVRDMMARSNRDNQRALTEYDRAQNDRAIHSVSYRQSIGVL